MEKFKAGINQYWVGVFTGLMIPVCIVAVIILITVSKVNHFISNAAIAPLLSEAQTTISHIDEFVQSADQKVDKFDLSDPKFIENLKNSNLSGEIGSVLQGATRLQKAVDGKTKDEIVTQLRVKLQASLELKYSKEQASQLTQSLIEIAQVLAKPQLDEAIDENPAEVN